MGLSILSPLPDLNQHVRDLQRENQRLTDRVRTLEDELRQERVKVSTVERGASELRKILGPLYEGLGMVFGQIDLMGVSGTVNAKSSPVWDSWKEKLGGQTAEAIDVLALHGEMNAEQLRIHLRCARTHVYNVISRLNKAGIINKNGGKISLKSL